MPRWSAARDMCRALNVVYPNRGTSPPGLVVSLLNTEKTVRDRFGPAFFVLLDVVRSIVPELVDDQRAALQWMRARSPSVVVAALMDALFARAQEHIERGEDADTFTGGVLMRVFVRAAEPVWRLAEGWHGGWNRNRKSRRGKAR